MVLPVAISLIDARSDSLTVTWPAVTRAKRYILEYKTDEDWIELSSKLTTTQARKRNLTPECAYTFRVAPVLPKNDNDVDNGEEITGSFITQHNNEVVFRTISTADEKKSMSSPKVSIGGNQTLLISWTKVAGAATTTTTTTGYELQMRENNGGETWKTIAASISGTEVKKKNLTSKLGYQFRVRKNSGDNDNDDDNNLFSQPSEACIAKGLSDAMKRWFSKLENGTLLRSGSSKPVPLADAIGSKEFVLLYVSASWCPPCRKYTPILANWYKTVKDYVEIIFLSADHDENGFKNYFAASHPWMAIDYDDDTRESLMATIKVSGVPRLVVINALTGNIVEDNAVGKPLNLNQWRGK
jgi:thiol-disulfide isomerase/thioredoxin